jgi:hypothetical protein
MLRNCFTDAALSIRLIAKHPAFSAAVILTLAIGIGATMAIFNILNAALIRPLPFKDPGRLVLVVR